MRAKARVSRARRASGRPGGKLAAVLLLVSLTLSFTCSSRGVAAGEEMLFPLLLPPALTSTFCEYRNGHFHSGIDLSTNEETGVPVVAVRSGYVYRVRASGVGYGKALYLLADNGMFAVYAHLESFSEKIQSFVLSKQMERNAYEVDVFPLPFQIPVERGEILGRSGNSGSSFGPHLHFELRRGGRALNPLAGFLPLEEEVRPFFRFAELTPVGSRSEIDGSHSPLRLRLAGTGERGEYGSSLVPTVAGRFFVSASVFDRTEKRPNKLSVYRVRLFLDDSLLFQNSFDEVEYARTHEVELAYNHRLAKRGENFTLNLCRFHGSRMGLLQRLRPGAGIIDVDSLGLTGPHTLRVEASDIAGNTSRATMEFIANRRPVVRDVQASADGRSAFVEAEVEDPDGELRSVWLDYALGGSGELARIPMTPVRSQDPQKIRQTGRHRYVARLELPKKEGLSEDGHDRGVFRVVAEDERGAASRPFTRTLPGPGGPITVSVDMVVRPLAGHAEIQVRVSPPVSRPRVGVARGDTLWLEVEEESEGLFKARYEFEPGSADGASAVCLVEEGGSRRVSRSAPLGVQTVRKGWKGTLWGRDARAGFRYGPETFYNDTYVTIEARGRGEAARTGLTFASDIFSFGPSDVAFDKHGTVIIRCDGEVAVSDRIAVYWRSSGRGKWTYAGAKVDTLDRSVSADVRNFWEFALLKDEAPPSVSVVRPVSGTVYRTARPPIYATVKDVGSGVTWHGTRVLIDGKQVLSIWDPKVSRLTVEHHEPLSPGRHIVTFEVTDRAGNTTTQSSHFSISG
ncbi:MAG: M23 family metallopeptidase [Candidatus Eiseniibacteriota bacterium]|nr:MAG: M23 family metallopeptidase [Candidatus Eisenbacteria bacterium]